MASRHGLRHAARDLRLLAMPGAWLGHRPIASVVQDHLKPVADWLLRHPMLGGLYPNSPDAQVGAGAVWSALFRIQKAFPQLLDGGVRAALAAGRPFPELSSLEGNPLDPAGLWTAAGRLSACLAAHESGHGWAWPTGRRLGEMLMDHPPLRQPHSPRGPDETMTLMLGGLALMDAQEWFGVAVFDRLDPLMRALLSDEQEGLPPGLFAEWRHSATPNGLALPLWEELRVRAGRCFGNPAWSLPEKGLPVPLLLERSSRIAGLGAWSGGPRHLGVLLAAARRLLSRTLGDAGEPPRTVERKTALLLAFNTSAAMLDRVTWHQTPALRHAPHPGGIPCWSPASTAEKPFNRWIQLAWTAEALLLEQRAIQLLGLGEHGDA